jgi:shikimate dehydrogenase
MMIQGDTTVYAVLGHPVAHSLSPRMHNAALQEMGLNAVYTAHDVHPEHLLEVLQAMRHMGYGGCNMTVPLKEIAFRGLQDIDESAQHLGAVNTVRFHDHGMTAYNTDGVGFIRSVEEDLGESVKGAQVCIAGVGGSGRAIAISCAEQGAAGLTLLARKVEKAKQLASEIQMICPGFPVTCSTGDTTTWPALSREADLVVNATPLGMKEGEESVLPAEAFKPGQAAYDLIYMTPETAFTRAAREGGARTCNGLGMLLYQGVYALEIWLEREPPVATMRRVLEEAVYG